MAYVVLGMLIYNNIEAEIKDLGSLTLKINAYSCYDASLHNGFLFWEAMSMEEVHDSLATANITTEDLPGLLQCSNHFKSISSTKKI